LRNHRLFKRFQWQKDTIDSLGIVRTKPVETADEETNDTVFREHVVPRRNDDAGAFMVRKQF
jgi:hypothetical protein